MFATLAGFGGMGALKGISLMEMISDLNELIIAFPIIFLILGVLYSFYGKRLFDIFNFLIGGFLALGFMYSYFPSSGILLIIILIGSFLIGGVIGFFAPYLWIGIVGFALGTGLLIGLSPPLAIVLGILFAAIAVVLFRLLLPAMTALIGGILAGTAVFQLTGSREASLIIGAILFIAGTIFQFSDKDSNRKEEKRKIEESND